MLLRRSAAELLRLGVKVRVGAEMLPRSMRLLRELLPMAGRELLPSFRRLLPPTVERVLLGREPS